MKTYYRILALALAGLLLPTTAATTAHATEGWVPDEALVVDVPAQYVDDDLAEQRQALLDLGLQPGDVVAVKWLKSPHGDCLGYAYPQCAYLEIGGRLHPVAEDTPFLVPHGPASLDGARSYPAFDAGLSQYDLGDGFSMGSAVYNDEPSRRGVRGVADYVDSGMLMHLSGETYDDGYVRVGVGLLDLWISQDDLVEPTPVDQPTEAEPTLTPEPTETPSAESTVEPDLEAQSAAEPMADTEPASASGESESSLWVPLALGGGLLLVVGLVVSLIASAVQGKRSA